ncbi:MAG: response regulator [Candidatus Omnitrophota bacterium]
MREKKRILIIDDEPDILRVVMFRLRKAGYEVLTAADGQAGWQMAKSELPNFILLDIRLPLMDGFEVCKKLKDDPQTAAIPVIFLSASSAEDLSSKSKEYNAEGFMRKPFEPDELLRTIEKMIGK